VRPDIVEDRKERVMLGNELQQAKLDIVFEKMEKLNHEHINLAIEKFRAEIEADTLQENMDSYFHMDTNAVLEVLLGSAHDTPMENNLHNILCYLLKIQGNPEKRYSELTTLIHV
jgi:signal transduction protein with GAF and PtsI domain